MNTLREILDSRPNFEVCNTGGNCQAYRHPCDDGGFILLTDAEDAALPEDDAQFIACGRYDEHGDPTEDDVECVEVADLEAWLDKAIGGAS